MKPRQRIINLAFAAMVALVTSTALIMGFMWIYSEYDQFREEAERTRSAYFTQQKAILKSEVDRIVDLIYFQTTQTERLLRDDIRERVNEALDIANHIYSKNKNTLGEKELRARIIEALRPIRFNDGRGYYFIVSMDGVEIMYPVFPEFEGQNLLDLRDEKGNYVLRDEIDVVAKYGEGFVTGYWRKPGDDTGPIYPKISFVKQFEPFDWYIGAGEYLDDVEQEIQSGLFAMISSIRFGLDKDQYIFISGFDGVELVNGVYHELVGDNLWELEDATGLKVIQKQVTLVKENPEGAFFTHHWFDETRETMTEKLTYVRGVTQWEWVVGSGIFTNSIENTLAQLKDQKETQIRTRIFLILCAVTAILLAALALVRYIARKVARNYGLFFSFFDKASAEQTRIDLDKIQYAEFRDLAEAANKMIDERFQIEQKVRAMNEILQNRVTASNREMEDLNETMEQKIQERTLELKRLTERDALTGLYNRRHLMQTVSAMMDHRQISGNSFCVIMFDLDNFKKVNDSYGHIIGDQVLKAVADVLRREARNTDIASRFGGEEFLVILPDTDLEQAKRVAERIRKNVMDLEFEQPGLYITISGGVAECGDETATELMERADRFLYQAKHKGKNRIESE